MWTPKRILLLFGILTLLVGSFGIYAYFFGGIDGVPALPSAYFRVEGPIPVLPPMANDELGVDKKLLEAFGNDCPEINRTIKAQVTKKGLAFSTNQFEILKDGRVRFQPFSIAIFNKDRKAGEFPEINTVRSEEAYLTFERPITSLAEMGDRKIVGAELRGEIIINNNRRTRKKNDDIEVFITQGPLMYSEPKKLIWSNGLVRLVDTQPQPEPTVITAKGVEIQLDKESSLNGGAKAKKAAERRSADKVSAVERIVLRGNVDMHLYIDSESPFLAAGRNSKAANEAPAAKIAADTPPPEPKKSHVNIKTQGPFNYDLIKDVAVFESPRQANQPKDAFFPSEHIKVTRINSQNNNTQTYDQLLCDRLELQFRRKKDVDPRAARGDQSSDREIASAKATSRGDHRVALTSDSENLEVHGQELIYYSPTDETGAKTIIRGALKSPLWAVKDAHKITCVELWLQSANAKGEGQQSYAKGPGQIDLMDAGSKEKTHQYHAVFEQTMTVVKDKEGDLDLDRLTFVGKAEFIDDAGKQHLQADKLEVWLEPADRTRTNDQIKQERAIKAVGAARQQPHKLEGFGHVRIRSPQLRVKQCDHLLVRFNNAPAPRLPEVIVPAAGSDENKITRINPQSKQTQVVVLPPKTKSGEKENMTRTTVHRFAPEKNQTPGLSLNGDDDNSRKPIDLQARDVSVYVVRAGSKNELQKVMTEGNVLVQQEGATPEDKGVHITGRALDLSHDPQGDLLIVLGEGKSPARLQLGDLILSGPKVTINQKDNTAEIEGIGYMNMPSNTTFEGGKPTRDGVRLTIHWNESMFFNGKNASFHGGVVAHQEESAMRCKNLHVALDRKVSLKEGQKKGKSANVERLVCTDQVDIVETKKNAAGGVIRFDRLTAAELTADNRYGPIHAPGPGRVFLWQPGSLTIKDKAQPKPAKGKEFYLTRVDYSGNLYSTKFADESRIAKFYDNVEVFYLPAKTPLVKIDPAKLPKGSLHLRCQQMQLQSSPAPGGKKSQVMIASNGVRFRTDEYYGLAEKVTYNQSTEIIIFEGRVGNRAQLYRLNGTGKGRDRIVGSKILYNRETGEIAVEGAQSIQGGGS